MKVKTQIVAVLVLAIAAVALLVPVAQAGQGTPGRIDAHDRAHFPQPHASTAMQDANQRFGIVSEPSQLLRLDANERQGPRVSTPTPTGSGISDTGFDWGAAVVGASFALMLALLIGASLLTARHYRGRPLPR